MTIPVPGDVAPGPVPQSISSIEGLLATIVSRLNEDQRKTLYSAMVSDGGLTIKGDGGLFVLDAAGNPIFTVEGNHLFSFWDYNDDIILRADPLGGLAEPWLSIPMYPAFIPNLAAGVTGAWTTPDRTAENVVWRGRMAQVTHPYVVVDGDWGYASGAGTATYRLYINGVVKTSWTATVVETTNHVADNSDNLHAQNLDIAVSLQCSTNAATAQVRAALWGASQRQSP